MNLRSLSLVFLFLLQVQTAYALDLPKPEVTEPVDLEADQLDFDQATGRYHARGNVSLSQGPLLLTSDELWWNQQTGEAEAQGGVHFTGPGEELSGEKITYNMQKGTGLIEDGEAYWQAKSLRLSGRRLERLGPSRFRVYAGRFTVCDGERPAWSVGSSQADVRIGGYLKARHALIYVKDVPVFYLPYFMVSIKTERETGFLMPRFGFSERRGTELSSAWYQVLGRNKDATFYLDHLSRLGTGLGAEFRYIFDRRQHGEFSAYTIFGRDGVDRWSFDGVHFGQMSDTVRLVVDAEYVNERDYFSDYGEVAGEYNKQKVISNVFVSRTGEKTGLTAQVKYIEDLEGDAARPWQAMPHLDFSIAPWRVAQTPFYLGLQSSYTNYKNTQELLGQRLMVRPTVAIHSYLSGGLEFDSEYGYRQRQYADLDEALLDSSGSDDFRARVATRVSRVYGAGHSRWLHSIEPEIDYLYAGANSGADLPDFDRFDQADPQNQLGYALVSRLTGKWVDAEGVESQREVAWLKISQNYDLRLAGETDNPFSELRSQLTLRPTRFGSVAFDSLYDIDLGSVTDFSIDGDVGDGRGNSLGVTYRKRRPESGLSQVDNINFRVETSLLKPVFLGYEQRYDFLESNMLEQVLALDYRQQCWGVKIDLRERELDRSIMLTLSLGGIGEIGKLGRSYDKSLPVN